jgi:hypothetical protein
LNKRPTATPDMFYKKGDLLDENEDEEIGEVLEGEKIDEKQRIKEK